MQNLPASTLIIKLAPYSFRVTWSYDGGLWTDPQGSKPTPSRTRSKPVSE